MQALPCWVQKSFKQTRIVHQNMKEWMQCLLSVATLLRERKNFRTEREGSVSLRAYLCGPGYPSHSRVFSVTYYSPFPSIFAAYRNCECMLLPLSSVSPSEIKLILCQSKSDWKVVFINHVKSMSRSHLKACKLVPSRLFELFIWPNRWLKRSFRRISWNNQRNNTLEGFLNFIFNLKSYTWIVTY